MSLFLSDVLVMKVLLGEGILKNFAVFLCFVFPDPLRDYVYVRVSSPEAQKKGVPVTVPTVTSQLHLAMLRSIRIKG